MENSQLFSVLWAIIHSYIATEQNYCDCSICPLDCVCPCENYSSWVCEDKLDYFFTKSKKYICQKVFPSKTIQSCKFYENFLGYIRRYNINNLEVAQKYLSQFSRFK